MISVKMPLSRCNIPMYVYTLQPHRPNDVYYISNITASVEKSNFGNFGGINPFILPLATPCLSGWS